MNKKSNHQLFKCRLVKVAFLSVMAVLLIGKLMAQPHMKPVVFAEKWIDQHFVKEAIPPFSFVYDGEKSENLIKNWKKSTTQLKSDNTNEKKTLFSYADDRTGLVINCTVTSFADFPAVELDLCLKNAGKIQTPILESIRTMDYIITGIGKTNLHWSKGAVSSFDDFMPQEKSFEKEGESLHLEPHGGRSSYQNLPFFNAVGENKGVVMGIGWSGDWGADFNSVAGGLSFKAGMQKTHFLLYPNEEIRMPKTMLLFYEGDQWDGQNLFRRFIIAHHHPKVNGKPLTPPITWGVFGTTPASVHLYNIDKIIEHKLPLDYYWVDAGWYGKEGVWTWYDTGSWDLIKNLYPNGFKPLSEKLEKDGRHLMVWFEPERVRKGSRWDKEHPEMLIGHDGNYQTNLGEAKGNSLMNLGDPKALKFVTDYITDKIKDFGLGTGCYRQDFNIEPAYCWQSQDVWNRQGITEAKYIEGLYAYWDSLKARFPGMIFDNCAGGGCRIDLETTGRAAPYWRTDGPRDAVAHQCHSYGLMAWIPVSATSIDREGNDYEFRSSMNSSLCINWQHSGDGVWYKLPKDFPYEWAKKTLDQYLGFRDYFMGDYYPLTPYSQNQDVWMAWQLNCPEKGEGMVQAFRRENCICTSACPKLRNLDPKAVYILKNLDSKGSTEMTGRVLMEKGLPISIINQPGAAVITYKKRR
ncbi:MAG: alpha-galactosidase [Bacteroidota bacterium]|nr:alpha-galactosidase [Bacteroidota bacterium]